MAQRLHHEAFYSSTMDDWNRVGMPNEMHLTIYGSIPVGKHQSPDAHNSSRRGHGKERRRGMHERDCNTVPKTLRVWSRPSPEATS
jgi:hypothetical protein